MPGQTHLVLDLTAYRRWFEYHLDRLRTHQVGGKRTPDNYALTKYRDQGISPLEAAKKYQAGVR